MATTTNFGWQTPDDTDLVKDGAAAIRTLGSSIDTSLVDLKGGTTGQILAKTSNTDMDFTWVANDVGDITEVTVSSPLTGGGSSGSVNVAIQDGTTAQKGAVQLEDSTSSTSTTKAATPNSVKSAYDLADAAIPESLVDAKGDLLTATADNTPARLAAGNNGETLVADSAATTGLRWQGNYAAGKNKIINGDFSIWQRGTSFSAYDVYNADRWVATGDRTSPSFSRQTFTPGSAPVSGYEGQFYMRWVPGSSGTFSNIQQRIEDVRTFANQTVTLSYWARISTGTATNSPYIIQAFGSGGSASVSTALSTSTITTDWTRFSHTFTVPSISGKTLGTGNYLAILPARFESASTANVDIWGVQLEAGNVATAFQTATGTLQGELAACQRYYQRIVADGSFGAIGHGSGVSTTVAYAMVPLKTTMRVTPTVFDRSGTQFQDYVSGFTTGTFALYGAGSNTQVVTISYTHGTAALTQFRPYALTGNGATDYIGLGAEL